MGYSASARPASPRRSPSTSGRRRNLPILFSQPWNRSAYQSDAAGPKCWGIDCDPGHDPGPRSTDFLAGGVRRCARRQPVPEIHSSSIAGALLFAGGLRIPDLPVLFGGHQFSWFVGLPLTMLWVLAITN